MRASIKLLSAVAVLATFGSSACLAQSWVDSVPRANGREAPGQSVAAPINSTLSSAEVYSSALAAGHANGQEAPGQSIAAPIKSTLSSDEVHQQALGASHAMGHEAPGQSTAMPMADTHS
jgi:hypothetical protein